MYSIYGFISILDAMKVIGMAEYTYVCVKHFCAPEKWILEKST